MTNKTYNSQKGLPALDRSVSRVESRSAGRIVHEGERKRQAGLALITLLVFAIISMTIVSAAIIVIMVNSVTSSKYQEGALAYYVAESGIENALLRMLRNPNYTGESDLPVGTGTVDISVSGTNPKTITSTGQNGDFIRKIQVQIDYTGGYFTITDWKEIF